MDQRVRNENRNRFNGRNGNTRKFRKNDNSEQRDNSASTSNDARNRDNRTMRPIGYRKLGEVLEIKSDTELILKLSSEKNGFLMLLEEKDIRPDFMLLILAALAKASECSSEQETVHLLVRFYTKIIPKMDGNANFKSELVMYSANLQMNLAPFSPKREGHENAVLNLLKFLRRLQLTLYQKSFDVVQYVVLQLTSQIEFINRKGNALDHQIVQLLDELNESIQNVDRMKAETEKHEVLMEPPEDFRKIPIYPTTEDVLYNHEPFIRKNVIQGKYVGGVDHYLDTQFRLLREDFVRPLRHGITEYVQLKDKAGAMKGSKYRIKDLNVYRNYNKRMITGSLMCLSPDDFKTFFFAMVAGIRNPVKLAKGEFQIKLEIENESMPEITPLITYVMVYFVCDGLQVYFEAYRHNLKVLQDLGPKNFPLERYIVDLNKEILPPSYSSKYPMYKISNGLTGDDAKQLPVQILYEKEWPHYTDFNMDESQFNAFQAALTKQLVVIQGPPGTGKTYIGLRIVEALLANTSERPILIVCYTNHALDQFLEGISRFCGQGELIRIGGKSQSEALQNFNLSCIKKEMRSKKQVQRYILQARFEINSAIKKHQEIVSVLEQQIEGVKNRFSGSALRQTIENCNPMHLRQLEQHSGGRLTDVGVLNWLGCEIKINVETNKDANQDDNEESDSNEEESEEPELEEVDDEEDEEDEEQINEIERNRLIDYDSDDGEIQYHLGHRPENQINTNNIVPIGFEDADGFRTVKWKKALKKQFKREITKNRTMPLEEAQRIHNINLLPMDRRWDLYRLWVKLETQKLVETINNQRAYYRDQCLLLKSICNQEDIEAVRNTKIIGMTTTGAAKYRHIIAGTRPKITIVEEAAEVLEAHIVTALCKETEHLILIGDHLQLRPNPAVYDLAKKFNLEISLFERLIKNQLDYYQLKQQHRMRPCISSLLVPTIYKQLLDHPSVMQYEDVKGIEKNMFFINHQQIESSQQETRSHMNSHEASFIVALCRYVILQGYDKSQVTILTTYSGQLHMIRKLMRDQHLLKGVRATVVDNYQGEENDIILLSLVRSNEEANIGFLKTSNRVNVALSRARKGLYCIGNFDCLAENTKLWSDLLQNLTIQEAFGDKLAIYCQNHPEVKNFVSSSRDFSQVPEGGCMLSCGTRLPCGHSCPSVCHIIDREHKSLYKTCLKKCDRIICENEHRCVKNCHFGDECGKCTVMVQKVRPECGHSVKVSCSSNPSLAYCRNPCKKLRFCGHQCKGLCCQLCDESVCNELVTAVSPCDHTVRIKCSDAKNKRKLLDACIKTCNVELKCGHLCKGTCGRCKYGRLHTRCPEKCTRELICGHSCADFCSVDCPPCKEECTNRCVHSKCELRCGELCPPCMEKCSWECEYLKCTKLCSEPCDRKLCDHPNQDLLECKHPSIGVCGEKIPHLCRICNKDEVEEIFFGEEDEEDARFIELEDCEHVIEVNGLINWMNAEPESAEPNSGGTNRRSIQLKRCPKCKKEIRHTKALNTFIQASLKDIHEVKLKTLGSPNENRMLQRDLNARANNKYMFLREESFDKKIDRIGKIYWDITEKTKFDKKEERNFDPIAKHLLISLGNKLTLAEQLQKICSTFLKRNKNHKNIRDEAITKFEDRIDIVSAFIKDFRNSEQERHDVETEMSFLHLMAGVIFEASAMPFNESGKKLLNDAFELAHRNGCATESVRNEFKRLIQEASKQVTGIGISIEEKNMVLKAMDLQKGHWYKCPNGHVYAIGECGGAMQMSKCPECSSVIGGTNHSLTSGNALATEMDGATEPSWPTNLMEQLRPFMD